MGTSAVPNPTQEALHPNESEPNTVDKNKSNAADENKTITADENKSNTADGNRSNIADENKPNRKSTAPATARPFLRRVRDSADAFGPLKSVAGCLCFILENCEVCSSSHVHYPQRLRAFQRPKANEQAIESLAPKVKALSMSLCTSVSESDFKEHGRRKKLER